jgi:hypothetical protein
MTGMSALPHLTNRISIYYSAADGVLAFSGGINLQRRLGESGPPKRNDIVAFPPAQFRMVDAGGF